ncbi:MAG TPA: TIGR03435 family protein [Bryobacteraceae bacterium]|nr:TIGR03435 family protein [Bryobacteraceae bacterium]
MKLAFLSAALCCAAFSQTSGKLAFEVASIKPADPSPMGQIMIQMRADAGMLRYTNVSLKDCIRVAYRIKDYQIEGPDFIGDTRYNITAKFPSGATESDVPEMLQVLLTDRFKLTVHREKKDHAVYALVADKGGPKLKPAEVPTGDAPPDGQGGARGPVGRGGRGGMMMSMGPDGMHVKASSITLADLGERLSRFTDKPIIDQTGIQGQYDFDLAFTPENVRGMPGGGMMMRGGGAPSGPGGEGRPAEAASDSGGTIFDAVQRYGLKLESRKAPMDIVVVDHMEKSPTEN